MQTSSATDGFLSPQEFADSLEVPRDRVLTWIREGRLPAVRLGQLVLIPVDALQRVLERQEGDRRS